MAFFGPVLMIFCVFLRPIKHWCSIHTIKFSFLADEKAEHTFEFTHAKLNDSILGQFMYGSFSRYKTWMKFIFVIQNLPLYVTQDMLTSKSSWDQIC